MKMTGKFHVAEARHKLSYLFNLATERDDLSGEREFQNKDSACRIIELAQAQLEKALTELCNATTVKWTPQPPDEGAMANSVRHGRDRKL